MSMHNWVDEKWEQYVSFSIHSNTSIVLNNQRARIAAIRNSGIQRFTWLPWLHREDQPPSHCPPSLSALESKPVTFHPGFPPKSFENSSSRKGEKKNVYASHTPEFERSNWDTYSDFLGESWLESRERAHPKTKCWPLWPMGILKETWLSRPSWVTKKKSMTSQMYWIVCGGPYNEKIYKNPCCIRAL